MENRNENKFKLIYFVGSDATYPQRNCLRHPTQQLGIYLGKNLFIDNKFKKNCDQRQKWK